MLQTIPEITTLEGPRFAFDGDYAVINLRHLVDLPLIQAVFNTVPRDAFVKDGSRCKSIYRARVRNGLVEQQEHGPLYQSAVHNYGVYGADCRPYPEMDPLLVAAFEPVVRFFAATSSLTDEQEVLVQAQRVIACCGSDGRTGQTAREDWHSDGQVSLGILVINRVNITGGVSQLAHDAKGARMILEQTLEPGDLLMIDDTKLFHNATPIHAIDGDRVGHRDIAILTWPACRPRRLRRRPTTCSSISAIRTSI